MSRDITIVILKTQSRDVDGYEFRVFETTTTNFGYNADYPRNKPVLNRYFLLERHSRAPIFFDEMEAWGYAADHLEVEADRVLAPGRQGLVDDGPGRVRALLALLVDGDGRLGLVAHPEEAGSRRGRPEGAALCSLAKCHDGTIHSGCLLLRCAAAVERFGGPRSLWEPRRGSSGSAARRAHGCSGAHAA